MKQVYVMVTIGFILIVIVLFTGFAAGWKQSDESYTNQTFTIQVQYDDNAILKTVVAKDTMYCVRYEMIDSVMHVSRWVRPAINGNMFVINLKEKPEAQ